ncbi:MAG: peptidase M3 [Phycisphaerae bacterium]|nr:peptidase M3 [Phycisphaerae bacterium]
MTTAVFVPEQIDATDWANLEALFRGLSEREVEDAEGYERWLVDRSELEAACSEARANLYINMTCETSDEEASKAYAAFIENVEPKLAPAAFELDKRQVELAERFGATGERHEVLHRDTLAEVELFREESVALKTKVQQLDQKYDTVCGAMTVEFDGEKKTLPQMSKYLELTDRAKREAAWRTVAQRRLQDRDTIDGIYDEMVGLRHRIANQAGFENYVGYAFKAMHRFDYTPADCRLFHSAVDRVVTPFCDAVSERRRAELGVDELRAWDLAVDSKGRSPLNPFEGGADLVAKTRRVMEALDGELADLFAELGDGSTRQGARGGASFDLDSRMGKAPGGYQYMLDRSRRPFIFMNAAGLHRDVETMVHEAGHAFHSMLCKTDPLLHYRHSPIEFAEVASMSMELLTMRHWGVDGGFYDNEADLARAKRKQLEGSISLFGHIATIDAFQHWVYENPEHTREQRTAAWLDLIERFGFRGSRIGWEEQDLPARDAAWHAQPHPFGVPFYYIEYGIAQLGALQLWVRSLNEGEDVAVAAYKNALALGGSRPLPELFEAAGIRFDFSAEMFATVREAVERELAKLPE